MMRLVALLALIAVAAADVPAFLWSPGSRLGPGATVHAGPVSETDLNMLVRSVAGTRQASPLMPSGSSPADVVVVFAHPQLSTAGFSALAGAYGSGSEDGGAFAGLKTRLAAAGSSLTLPNVQAPNEAFGRAAGAFAVTPEELELELDSGAAFHNKAYAVALPDSLVEAEALVARLSERVAAAVGGERVVFVETAERAAPARAGSARRLDTSLAGEPYEPHWVYITPTIFEGLMVGLIMVSAMLIGICCLMDIQGPSRFSEAMPLKGKEF